MQSSVLENFTMQLAAFVQGLIFQLGLIVALGPQNLFVLYQGLERKHASTAAIVCMACDLALISIAGFSGLAVSESLGPFAILLRYAGVALLSWYGYTAFA